MLETTCFDVSVDKGVAHLSLSRPDAYNTMTREFWRELPALVRDLDSSGDVRALVLSSTGKHFCAGLDLNAFSVGGGGGSEPQERGRAGAAQRQNLLALQEALTSLERMRVPVLAAVQGGCVGGGVDLICACDARYATDDAFFCIQEINIGITADVGTLQRLPRLIPDGVARELAYTGRRLPAQRAVEVGLVNQLFPSHQALLEGVIEVAHEIAERSPIAIHGSKEMLNYTRDHSVTDGLNYIATWATGMASSEDVAEAMTAKREGRAPEFRGLPPLRGDD